jgi:hypothetical protein
MIYFECAMTDRYLTREADGSFLSMLCEFFSVIERIHSYPETFIIRPGGAHNLNDVMRVLTHDERHLITFTIGNKPKQKATKAIRTSARREGMETLLAALSVLRNEWDLKRPPLLCMATTTGISDKRDILLVFYSLYLSMLVVPHRDKKAMEDRIVASRERFVVVRPSMLWDGGEDGEDCGVWRCGCEDGEGGEEGGGLYHIERGTWGVDV